MEIVKRQAPWAISAALVCGTIFVVHAQSIHYDFVNWDDDQYVLENPLVTNPSALPWWHFVFTPSLGYPTPITIITYRLEYLLFGLHPTAFHITNLCLHALVAVSLMLVCRAWLRADLSSTPILTTLITLCFALHPATVEPAVWISGRKDLLAAFFSLITLAQVVASKRKIGPAMCIVLAFLSKPSTVFLPLFLTLIDPKRKRLWLCLQGLGFAIILLSVFLEKKVGALGPIDRPANIVFGMLSAAARHALIVAFPLDLSPKYIDPPGGPTFTTLLAGALLSACYIVITLLAYLKRHPAWPWLVFALLTYLPSSGIVPLNRQYSDSYVYLPMAALSVAAATTLQGLIPILRPGLRVLSALAAAILAIALAAVSSVQATIWKDGVTLWTYVYLRYPDSPQVCRNLGNAWMFSKRFEPMKSAAVYKRCVETLDNRPFFLKNLAIANFYAGDFETAKALFTEFLETSPGDPIALEYLKRIANAHSK